MWCSLQRNISHTLQNWDTQRPYSARLDERIPGFTEDWDNHESTLEGTTNSTKCPPPPPPPHRTIGGGWDQQYPECHIRLFQYRPAWFEQVVLRVSKIPHVVVNSSYAVTEVTGPLPMLQDFEGGSPPSRDTQDSPPAMVGRYQIVSEGDIPNSILDYLKLHRGVDLDSVLVNEEQIQQSASFVAIIRDTLGPCLVALRYNADPMAWEQIYRPQCISATSGSSWNGWKSRPMLAMWQAWSEKVHAIASLSSSQRQWTKESIIETVRRTYAILEHQLKKINSASKLYLLGTETPTTVDCLLWDHLMEALADVHLVIVLADFPELLKFTQTIWDKYSFGTIVEEVGVQGSSVWVWNMEENATNAFASIPLLPETKRVEKDSACRAGVDMMNNLRMLQNDLGKSLALIKQQHHSISYPMHRNQPLATTWHRWRMGGGLLPNQKATGRSGMSATEEMSRRQYQRNDEIWMMSVVATTVIAMVGFGFVG